jgi:hypothetical protein
MYIACDLFEIASYCSQYSSPFGHVYVRVHLVLLAPDTVRKLWVWNLLRDRCGHRVHYECAWLICLEIHDDKLHPYCN